VVDVSKWWMVAVLFLTAVVSYTDRLILSVLVDPLRTDLGLTDSGVSLLQGAAFTLVYVFASLPLARVADRRCRRNLILAGACLWCLSTVLCGFAPGFGMLFVGRLFVGVGEATLVPAAVSMVADAFPPARRGTGIGLFAMGTVIGGPFGISAGGMLLAAATEGQFADWPVIGALAPWRSVLVFVGVAGLAIPLLLLTVREPTRIQPSVDNRIATAAQHFIDRRSVLLPLYLGMALLSIGDYGLYSWAPTTLTRVFQWQSGKVGMTFGIVAAVAGIAGSVGGGLLSDAAGRRGGVRGRLIFCACAASAAALAGALVCIRREELVLLGIGLWLLTSTIAGIGGVAVLQEVVPGTLRATSASLLTFCNTLLGLGCGPTLIALATDHVYASPAAVGLAISTVALPAALTAALAFLISRHRVERAPPSRAVSPSETTIVGTA